MSDPIVVVIPTPQTIVVFSDPQSSGVQAAIPSITNTVYLMPTAIDGGFF